MKQAAEMYADQHKHPGYDLLLASYNELKAENNKQALEINRLMSGQKVISDEEIIKGMTKEFHKIGYDLWLLETFHEWSINTIKWYRDQLNKQ